MRRYLAVPNPHETLPLASLEADDLPSFGPSLAELARPGMRATIAFTDSTRRCPDERLIGRILRRLESCGVRRDDVTLLCATGLHRSMNSEERVAKLGASIAGSVAIAD